jgi:hypothetical protein
MEDFNIQMVIPMRVIGFNPKPTDKEFIKVSMVEHMKVLGLMTNSMVMELNCGRMDRVIKDNTKMEKRTASENKNGKVVLLMRENISKI